MKYLVLVCCLGLSVAACGDDPERPSPRPCHPRPNRYRLCPRPLGRP